MTDTASSVTIPMSDEPQRAEQVQQWASDAALAIDKYEAEGMNYASLCFQESELEAHRPVLKEQIKARLMQAESSLSATRAEEKVKTDTEYLEHLEVQRRKVLEKDNALTRMMSARLQAELAIATIKYISGLR